MILERRTQTKIQLLYELFGEHSIPDELVLKILYEFKGLGNKEAPILSNNPCDVWNRGVFKQPHYLFGDIERFWKGSRKLEMNPDCYKPHASRIKRKHHNKNTMKKVDNQEWLNNIRFKIWNEWWDKKMNYTTIYNNGNSCIKSWVEDTHNAFDVGHTMAKDLLFAKHLQVELTLFIHNYERYDSEIYKFGYTNVKGLFEDINLITDGGLEIFGIRQGLAEDDYFEILENAIDQEWRSPKSSRDRCDKCDICNGRFPKFFMKYQSNNRTGRRATNLKSLIYDDDPEEVEKWCSYCSLEDETDPYDDINTWVVSFDRF